MHIIRLLKAASRGVLSLLYLNQLVCLAKHMKCTKLPLFECVCLSNLPLLRLTLDTNFYILSLSSPSHQKLRSELVFSSFSSVKQIQQHLHRKENREDNSRFDPSWSCIIYSDVVLHAVAFNPVYFAQRNCRIHDYCLVYLLSVISSSEKKMTQKYTWQSLLWFLANFFIKKRRTFTQLEKQEVNYFFIISTDHSDASFLYNCITSNVSRSCCEREPNQKHQTVQHPWRD